MQFHTWSFLVFSLVVFAVYGVLRRTRFWTHWLLAASYFFYGWWNPLYLLLIVYSTFVDYGCVAMMRRAGGAGRRRARFWLATSVVNNLGLLGFYKYAGFVAHNLSELLAYWQTGWVVEAPDVLLPVGISFYTFQSMSYTIDYYRGRIECEPSFVRFAAYVAFFPQLVAGPIERASSLLPQLRTPPAITWRHWEDGLSLFVIGLFKKVALADFLAIYVDRIYANPAGHASTTLAVATIAFAWQIYFDFSGYTDMARGVARCLGFDLMLNFRHPYLATSVRDFWGRWHISLSTWFRDYVYIPLGGNRHGRVVMYRNLLVTMIVSGIWHGAAWTYVIWGALHGLAYLVWRPCEAADWYQRLPRLVKQLMVFGWVCAAWVFFRAETLSDALLIFRRIASGIWGDPQFPVLALIMVGGVLAYQAAVELTAKFQALPRPITAVAYFLMLVYVSVAVGRNQQAFIYFQF